MHIIYLLILVVTAADDVQLVVEYRAPEVAGLHVGDCRQRRPASLTPLVVETDLIRNTRSSKSANLHQRHFHPSRVENLECVALSDRTQALQGQKPVSDRS